MIPGMNIDPRRMQSLMKQMGIENKELSAKKVTIELEDGSCLLIENPSVSEIKMQGNTSFQIVGEPKLIASKEIPEEDIVMVSESSNVSKEKAKDLLEKTQGDIAQAILLAKEE